MTSSPAREVFISYKREEVAQARQLRMALMAMGLNVWWDEELQVGGRWEWQIDQALLSAAAVVVLWSPLSTHSDWVKHEASVAKVRRVLVPAFISKCEIPEHLRSVQALDLTKWTGSEKDPSFQKLCTVVRRALHARRRGVALRVTLGVSAVALGVIVGVVADRSVRQWRRSRVAHDTEASVLPALQAAEPASTEPAQTPASDSVPDKEHALCETAIKTFKDCESTQYEDTMNQCKAVRGKMMNAACAPFMAP